MNRPSPKDYPNRRNEYVLALEAYCDYLEKLIWLKTKESEAFIQPT